MLGRTVALMLGRTFALMLGRTYIKLWCARNLSYIHSLSLLTTVLRLWNYMIVKKCQNNTENHTNDIVNGDMTSHADKNALICKYCIEMSVVSKLQLKRSQSGQYWRDGPVHFRSCSDLYIPAFFMHESHLACLHVYVRALTHPYYRQFIGAKAALYAHWAAHCWHYLSHWAAHSWHYFSLQRFWGIAERVKTTSFDARTILNISSVSGWDHSQSQQLTRWL